MDLTFEQAVVISTGLSLLEDRIKDGSIANNFFSTPITELIEQVRAKLAEA
jgi:hypothetical protein